MTKYESLFCMQSGQRIFHKCYSGEEWLTMNDTGLIEANDGELMGDEHGRFWRVCQEWNDGWEVHQSCVNKNEREQFTVLR